MLKFLYFCLLKIFLSLQQALFSCHREITNSKCKTSKRLLFAFHLQCFVFIGCLSFLPFFSPIPPPPHHHPTSPVSKDQIPGYTKTCGADSHCSPEEGVGSSVLSPTQMESPAAFFDLAARSFTGHAEVQRISCRLTRLHTDVLINQ